MSASKTKRSVWSRIMGIFKVPDSAPEVVAAHLRSMSPEAAARLMGPGSVPPRIGQVVKPAMLAAAATPELQDAPDLSELPMPLLRATGVFQAEHAKIDRALAQLTADRVAQLDSELSALLMSESIGPSASAHRLAARLAIVARLNQPASRGARMVSAKALASTAAAKSAVAKPSAHGASMRTPVSVNVKPGHDAYMRPQAVVIDLAAVKVLRRSEKARRAA